MTNYQDARIRLTQFEINAIITVFKQCFDKSDSLWVFGSRIDPAARGGDIDLYVKSIKNDMAILLNNKISFLVKLQSIIGEQKIDVVLDNGRDELPIYQIAKNGIKLV